MDRISQELENISSKWGGYVLLIAVILFILFFLGFSGDIRQAFYYALAFAAIFYIVGRIGFRALQKFLNKFSNKEEDFI